MSPFDTAIPLRRRLLIRAVQRQSVIKPLAAGVLLGATGTLFLLLL